MSSRRAPDGKPWPLPQVLVDTSEQIPWAFGHVPAAFVPGAPVHHGVVDPESPVFEITGRERGPWKATRANLESGDYQLECSETGRPLGEMVNGLGEATAPGLTCDVHWRGPIVIERKQKDLGSSLTTTRAQLEAECMRMVRDFARAFIITATTFERITRGDLQHAAGREKSMLGSLMAFQIRYGIHVVPCADRWTAEYMGAWYLWDVWRRWLMERPEALRCIRASEGSGHDLQRAREGGRPDRPAEEQAGR